MHTASSTSRRLLLIALAYLPVAAAGAILSFAYDVGAQPGGKPGSDLVLRGTALAPPLFLPVALVLAAAMARGRGSSGVIGAGVAGVVGVAFMLGSTANLPNDLSAARAAGSPTALTIALAGFHLLIGALLLWHGAVIISRRRSGRP